MRLILWCSQDQQLRIFQKVRERQAPQHRRGQNILVRSQLRLRLQWRENYLGVPEAFQDENNVANKFRNSQKPQRLKASVSAKWVEVKSHIS